MPLTLLPDEDERARTERSTAERAASILLFGDENYKPRSANDVAFNTLAGDWTTYNELVEKLSAI